MEKVWESLGRHSENPDETGVDFIDTIVRSATDWIMRDDRTKGEVREAYRRLANKVDAIAEEISKLPWRHDGRVFLTKGQIAADAADAGKHRALLEPVNYLASLSAAIRKAADNYEPLVPKIRAGTSERTFMIRRLNAFMLDKVETPLHEHVATVVNLLLNDEIDSDHVRKIVDLGVPRSGTKSSSN